MNMATCKDCLHYDICVFHLKGNENEKCLHFKNKTDLKAEVARKIFADMKELFSNYNHNDFRFRTEYWGNQCAEKFMYEFTELENKYTKEGVENEKI